MMYLNHQSILIMIKYGADKNRPCGNPKINKLPLVDYLENYIFLDIGAKNPRNTRSCLKQQAINAIKWVYQRYVDYVSNKEKEKQELVRKQKEEQERIQRERQERIQREEQERLRRERQERIQREEQERLRIEQEEQEILRIER